MQSLVGEHGEGGWTPTQDGRISVRVTMLDGTRVTRMVSRRLVKVDPKEARREAEKLRRELVARRDAELVPSRLTLADWLRSWIAAQRDGKRIRYRTLAGYAMIVERHVVPTLGSVRLVALRPHHVQTWVDGMAGSAQSIAHRRAVLRLALGRAVGRYIDANPAAAVDAPHVPIYRQSPLTVAEARALLTATADDRTGILWRMALDTGLRQAELLGLGWDDLDLDAGTVTVASQLQRRDGQWVRVALKVARDLATLSLTPSTVAALREHKIRQANERKPGWRYFGHVFLTRTGRPYHGSEVLRAFRAACRRAGIAERRFHDIRSSTATILRELGVSKDDRKARLGHTSDRMADHYGKARTGADRGAADRLEGALG